MGTADPTVSLLVILVIGIVAGVVYDRFLGPGWLTRQVTGATRGTVTGSLVGIAGSFIGFHLGVILGVIGLAAYLAAILGAAVVLFAWRAVR